MSYNFEALNEKDRLDMQSSIGIDNVDELFDVIDKKAKLDNLDLKDGIDELEAMKHLKKLSSLNNIDYISFLGGGSRNRYIPSVIYDVANRFEFLSCYTPYQAEISQGTLTSMYEFQSIMASLTNKDVSNASMYDGATATAEAILMSVRITKNRKVYISKNINPNYLSVIKTYLWAQGIEITDDENDENLCAKVYQSPNYFGEFEQMPNKTNKELIISILDLFSLALFEPAQSDITVAEIQPLGIKTKFGGSWAGVITTKDEYKRQIPGRIVGKTVDKEGNIAYCLTMQTREQHIRRQKATSNICSNQAQIAFLANLYLRKLGKTNFIKLAQKSYDNAHLLYEKLKENNINVLNKDFFDEFVFEIKNAKEFLNHMKQNKILAGIEIEKDKILVSPTEINDEKEINLYIDCLKKFI